MKNKCTKCNMIFPDDMMFCSKCGSKLVQYESKTEAAGKWMKSTGQKSVIAAKVATKSIANSKAAKIIKQKKDELSEKIANSYVICKNCGEVLQPGSKFCNVCGQPVPERKKPVQLICSKCGAELKENSKFCNICGAEVVLLSQTPSCPNCGVEITENDVFCSECGYKLKEINTIPEEKPKTEELKVCSVEVSPIEEELQREEENTESEVCSNTITNICCSFCGTELPEGGLFCPECGIPCDSLEESEDDNNEAEISVEAEEIIQETEPDPADCDLTAEDCCTNCCEFCGAEIPEEGLFCPECGSPINTQDDVTEELEIEDVSLTNTCSHCGEQLPEGAMFCPECGTKQN